MTLINLTVDEKGYRAADELAKWSKVGVKKAAYNAIKRTTSKMRTGVSKHVRTTYTAKAKDIKKSITTKNPTLNNLVGIIRASGSPLPVTAFKVNPNPNTIIKRLRSGIAPKRRRRSPMRVQIRKGGASGSVPGLFVQQSSKSGYAGPMHRYLKSRYPLRIPYGPSVPQMVGNKRTLESFVPNAQEFFQERFIHELKVQMRRIK